jgi:hypothetical protein
MKRQSPAFLVASAIVSILVIAAVSYYKAAKATQDASGNLV